MPKKTKEQEEAKKSTKLKKEELKQTKNNTSTKKVSNKSKVETSDKKTVSKKSSTKSTSKTSKEKTVSTRDSAKKISTKKTSSKKKTATSKSKKATVTANKIKKEIVEYYDLPYRYNQTIVKVLAQTPTNLFIYWDISDDDRASYIKEYGENFFENTKPVLIIYNDTLNYSFEVEINDFANSWYLHVNDSKCDYRVELGRRPKIHNNENPIKEYIYISSSNEIESPNDKILFDKNQQMVYFKNVKTNYIDKKSIANVSFIRNMGKIYNIYDLYKQIYKNENIDDLSNPSSGIF